MEEVDELLVGIGSTYLAELLWGHCIPDTGQSNHGSCIHQSITERVAH